MIRQAYTSAAGFFVEAVQQVREEQWEHTALGVWSVRDLVGHASRAFLTVEMYLDAPAAQVDLVRPIDYSIRAAAGLGNPAAVAARGREAGAALGAEPRAAVQEMAARALARVAAAADESLVGTPIGGMRLIDYLPTRIVELVMHGLDVRTALELPSTVPQEAALVTLHYLSDLAVYGPSQTVVPLLLTLTGRRSAAGNLNVFGL
ncbi:MAG: maleylpyruvate isomerase N-terminal domain-containing protein [Candidatus Tectimicrobiota bacterium]